jgi:plasmid stabilization system protein ParE
MVERIRSSVERMSLFPEAGSMVPEFEERELREIFVQSYRIIYRVEQDCLTILTIVHGARNLPDTFRPT